MEQIALVLAASVIVEAIIEYIKSIRENPEQVASLVIGIFVAWVFQVQAFNLMGFPINGWADMVLTGLLISRGSNYASDLIKRVNGGVAEKLK